jgi:membrane associated rhomboid family serine protease
MSITKDKNDEGKESGTRKNGRVFAVFIVAFYGSIFLTLVGLYFAVTRLGQLSPAAAASLIGFVGALVIARLLPITLRDLRERKR